MISGAFPVPRKHNSRPGLQEVVAARGHCNYFSKNFARSLLCSLSSLLAVREALQAAAATAGWPSGGTAHHVAPEQAQTWNAPPEAVAVGRRLLLGEQPQRHRQQARQLQQVTALEQSDDSLGGSDRGCVTQQGHQEVLDPDEHQSAL